MMSSNLIHSDLLPRRQLGAGTFRRHHHARTGLEFRIGDHGLAREDPANEQAAIVGSEERYRSPLNQA